MHLLKIKKMENLIIYPITGTSLLILNLSLMLFFPEIPKFVFSILLIVGVLFLHLDTVVENKTLKREIKELREKDESKEIV